MKRLISMLQFDIYLKCLLEAYVFNILAAGSEVARTDDATLHTASYTIAAVMLVLWLGFSAFILGFYFTKNSQQNQYFKLFYVNLRRSHLARLYNFFFTLRRILIVLIIVALEDVFYGIRVGSFLIFQGMSLMYVIAVKPFENWKDNLIEILNDTLYVILSILMLLLEEANDASTGVTMNKKLISLPMVYMVVLNGILIGIVVSVDTFRNIRKFCKKDKPKIRVKVIKPRYRKFDNSGAKFLDIMKLYQQSETELDSSKYMLLLSS